MTPIKGTSTGVSAIGVLILIALTLTACGTNTLDWTTPEAPLISELDVSETQNSGSGEHLNSNQESKSAWDPTIQERIRFAFPSTGSNSLSLDRVLDGGYLEWPEMKYLGEPAYVHQDGTTITPMEMLVYESGPVVQYYNPQEGYPIDAPTGLPANRQGHSLPAVMVPPHTSLVLVHLDAEYDEPCTETTAGETLWFGNFRISYPALGASTIEILDTFYYTELGDFHSVDHYCTESGWAYFLVPGVSLDPTQLWLEYLEGTDIEDLAIWSLSTRSG